MVRGLFFGLATVDLQYQVECYPAANTKNPARAFAMQTGGPAANAAVAFAHLGGEARLLTRIGRHPLGDFLRADLAAAGVEVVDLAAGEDYVPPFSSVVSERATGSRTIFNSPLPYRWEASGIAPLWQGFPADVALLDGFLYPAALDVARHFRAKGMPVVFDGGSWKEATPALLETVSIAICSENFHPPGGDGGPEAVFERLAAAGIAGAAITRGERPVLYREQGRTRELPVPVVEAVDTLGAGDIFHGAFAFHLAAGREFTEALREAGRVAARSCTSFGTRAWMRVPGEASP